VFKYNQYRSRTAETHHKNIYEATKIKQIIRVKIPTVMAAKIYDEMITIYY